MANNIYTSINKVIGCNEVFKNINSRKSRERLYYTIEAFEKINLCLKIFLNMTMQFPLEILTV